MITFDKILPMLVEILLSAHDSLATLGPVLINRDLNGRVRLIIGGDLENDLIAQATLRQITESMMTKLAPHAFPAERAVMYEPEMQKLLDRENTKFPLTYREEINGRVQEKIVPDVYVVDRLLSETSWTTIANETQGKAKRVVFFSIKGGVGRSTALAVSAWALAEQGKRVLVLDLDLESPGLSSTLLPDGRRPQFGITDWLLEDLVDNGQTVFDDMVVSSSVSHNGEILVVPAHGQEPGEYLSKLGRAWMPKVGKDGSREIWSSRLNRLLDQFEARYQPDVVLIDSRAGIDEISSACITDLGANLILLFALEGSQTWMGYRILFDHWQKAEVIPEIRERLQMVCALMPETEREVYLQVMREKAWSLMSEACYEAIPPGAAEIAEWSFDVADEDAPHALWPIDWHRSFYVLPSLHERLNGITPNEVEKAFGQFLPKLENYIKNATETERV
ncbi:MAG: hypothetical protein RLZZ298_1550 [Pseudomonadota bacterium]|jgi:hypothetical protein